jgi:hypothetical protein
VQATKPNSARVARIASLAVAVVEIIKGSVCAPADSHG